MSTGLIFNVQKFCVNDGPGIRTTVFFKGCPLRCKWCHNPESHLCKPELFYDAEKCVGCARCSEVCPKKAHTFEDIHKINNQECISCGACADECSAGAIELIGKKMTAQEIIDEVLKDKVFYDDSGGGITLSGGEPLMQFDFAFDLLRQAKQNGIHTCVETCGYSDTKNLKKIAEFTDIFLFDWKITDNILHKKYTGVSNKPILDNLKMLDSMGAKIILRCPIIPNLNDNEEHFSCIADIANSNKNIFAIEVEPYHFLGNHKYEKLLEFKSFEIFEMPNDKQVSEWIAKIQSSTKITVKKA